MGHRVSLTPRCHSAKVWDDSATLEVRRKSAISRLCGSGSYGPERGADGTVLLRVPAPHVVAARAYRIPNPSTSGLYKLTRLLNQAPKQQTVVDDTNVPRRLSWERRVNNSRLPRSSSIDSMVETVWADSIAEATTPPPIEKRPSLRPDRPLTLVSPTVGRRMKGQRGVNVSRKKLSNETKPSTLVMGKVSQTASKRDKKMSEIISERRRIASNQLKRSKSVRASLRYIGNRLLHQKDTDSKMQKSPSMSNLRDHRRSLEFKRNFFNGPHQDNRNFQLLPSFLEKEPVETILKTPVTTEKVSKSQLIHFGFRKVDSCKNKKIDEQVMLSQPPPVVAPKAAAVLQIPIKENCEPVFFRGEMMRESFQAWTSHKNGKECDPQGRLKEFNGGSHAFNGLQRTSLRLSITSRRKSSMWNTSFSTSKLPSLPSEHEMEITNAPLSAGLPPQGHKPSKKQAKLMQQRLERLARINIHLQALFAAVEHGHLEKARTILESTDVDVNSLNSDGLSPLDVAVLSNNRPLVKMLIGFGAREGNQFPSSEKLGGHLKQLLGEAEMRLQELGGLLEEPCGAPFNTRASFSSIIGNAYPASAMTGCAGGDTDKQVIAWGRRVKVLRRMVLGFAQARPPDPPSLVAVDITSSTSIAFRLQEPNSNDSAINTKYKIQWSARADFAPITGEKEILDVSKPNCTIEVTQGRRYFCRAVCGNLKGWGTFLSSTPTSVVPSSWREIDRKEPRFEGKLTQLDTLVDEVKQVRPGSEMLETPGPQRRAQRKKTTIKQLFSAASKFQKNLKRGIYLACILYHEDKVLVTNEDFLPVIEIDETFPSCIHTDLHWLMKVACTWDDTKFLRSDMEKNASSAIHFRTKLLSAALQMQSALCLQDLGQLYYKPLRDAHGTVVLSTINYMKSPKSVSVLNSRWLPMNKVFKKVVLSDDHSISEILMASIQEQINYHQVSGLKLSKGLYLAYLKMQSSVDLIQVVVPAKSPNMLPHCKVRDNPHVSGEEWEYLKHQNIPDIADHATEQQRTFLDLITSAAKRLFNYMDISNEDALTHRLCDSEIVDLTDEVSFIVICPSAEFSCSVPGQREILLQRGDLLSLPIQVFEMIHLSTYQSNIIQKYAKLSCLLELDAATANHLHREAFSNSEVVAARERLAKLQDLQMKLNSIWKGVRWLMDVITFARDRITAGLSLKYILDKEVETNSNLKRSLLQIPNHDTKIFKSTPGRGSWPGPGATNSNTNSSLLNEFSKSEQQLSKNESVISCQYLSATSDESRKNSDSYSSDYFNERLPPSRSEDTLFSSIPVSHNHRCRASTVSSTSATSSPLLSVRPMFSGSLLSVNTLNTTNTSDSMHSLSSDSEASCPIPISSSTPRKSKHKPKIVPSRSMTNVKQNLLDSTCKSDRYYSRHLSVDPNIFSSNLQTTSSKSLTNIKNIIDVSTTQSTYLKPLDTFKKSDVGDSIFKVPYSDAGTSTSSKDYSLPGILQVYAAYETGLASGTSLKLHVTPRTTAREVVDLVVKQLNMAVVLKGKDGPIYTADKLKNFCLVAVIGARERCLRDDFKPLQLQNPWKKGRLYVRQKQDVLAALEHSSKHSQII